MTLAARGLVAAIRVYQRALSPLTGGHCRFVPSCSDYAISALTERGAVVGSLLAAKRLARCHPIGGNGYDPVPPREENEERRRETADQAACPVGLSGK